MIINLIIACFYIFYLLKVINEVVNYIVILNGCKHFNKNLSKWQVSESNKVMQKVKINFELLNI